MKPDDQIDLFAENLTKARRAAGLAIARRLADQGAQRAADHADAEEPGWTERAYGILVMFCARFPREAFTSEDVRLWAEQQGLPPPPDARAWGTIFRLAAKRRVIMATGQWREGGALCHGRPQRVWMGE